MTVKLLFDIKDRNKSTFQKQTGAHAKNPLKHPGRTICFTQFLLNLLLKY